MVQMIMLGNLSLQTFDQRSGLTETRLREKPPAGQRQGLPTGV